MTELDDLHELLERRCDAADDLVPGFDDVISRARRRHSTRRTSGIAASMAVIALVAVAVVAGRGRAVEVNASADEPSTTSAAREVTRTLADGHVLRVAEGTPIQVYGPYGGDGWWHPSASCSPPLAVSDAAPATGAETAVMSAFTLPGPGGDGQLLTAMAAQQLSAPNAVTYRLILVVTQSTPDTTYQLVEGKKVIDAADGDGGLVVLAEPTADITGPTASSVADPSDIDRMAAGIRLRKVDTAGRSLGDSPLPTASPIGVDSATGPAQCSTPDVRPGTAPADATQSTAQIEALVSAMISPGGDTSDVLPRVDGADAEVRRAARSVRWTADTSVRVEDLVWQSPTVAWVRYQVAGDHSIAGQSPELWARVAREDGTWRLSRTSVCVLAGLWSDGCSDVPHDTPLTSGSLSMWSVAVDPNGPLAGLTLEAPFTAASSPTTQVATTTTLVGPTTTTVVGSTTTGAATTGETTTTSPTPSTSLATPGAVRTTAGG